MGRVKTSGGVAEKSRCASGRVAVSSVTAKERRGANSGIEAAAAQGVQPIPAGSRVVSAGGKTKQGGLSLCLINLRCAV